MINICLVMGTEENNWIFFLLNRVFCSLVWPQACYVSENDPELLVLLPVPPKCWNYYVQFVLGNKPTTLPMEPFLQTKNWNCACGQHLCGSAEFVRSQVMQWVCLTEELRVIPVKSRFGNKPATGSNKHCVCARACMHTHTCAQCTQTHMRGIK